MDRLETIVGSMASNATEPSVQLAQTAFRVELVDGWGIRPGESVLEIGCGQGDMTAVLADAVGPAGRVVGLDIADPSYGAPITVGDSAAFLMASPLGGRVDMRFEVDVLDAAVTFADGEFDHVVLSHCAWYFDSVDQVERVLRRVRPWARRLCFAEWDLRPTSVDQVPHLLAVLVQGQVEAAGVRGDGNVRTPFSRESLLRGLECSGWAVLSERALHGAALQDADWEIEACLRLVESTSARLPDLARAFVDSQVDVLGALAREKGNEPLPSYALIAGPG
ncbi:class I SAM-dependent methyltransferase [Umezawaea endophytica]|uniref:Methyltransferase domain-containing protein n=1 Tax=Umezawaea endophytica TaxID=1654476 RepID=A0A9X2ZY08_9PSEU|nr:methyltransferase domain-containing protein [Umezawaea endophytica]MCS7475949.1 methyltransferase domain-containing protein [Umezawaea endophytica]